MVRFAAFAFTLGLCVVPAASRAADVIATSPSPHPASCSDFQSAGPNMWIARTPIVIRNGPNTQTINPGLSFSTGITMAGIDLGAMLARCPRR